MLSVGAVSAEDGYESCMELDSGNATQSESEQQTMQNSIQRLSTATARTLRLLSLLLASLGCDSAFAATVTTDREDYQPGMTVLITGAGWTPGETITLHLDMSCGCAHPDWHSTAHADGALTNSDFVIQPHHLGVTFLLTATGQTSGLTAQTTFTDGRLITSVTLNGASSVMVPCGSVITAAVTVVTDQTGANARWRSTSWRIATTPPGTTNCVDTPDHDPAGTNTETFTITAPAAPGTYNAYFIANNNDNCSSGASLTFTLTNAVIVQSVNPSITCPSNVAVQCHADVPPPNTNSVTASSGAAVTHEGDVAVTNGCEITITRTYKASTTCGMATCSQIITVRDTIPPQSCVTAPANMVSWWRGENNANDIQGTNHGSFNGAFAAGKVGQAFSLNGVNQSVLTPLDVQPSAMPSTTWDAWVFPTRVNHFQRQAIFSGDDAGFDRGVLIEVGTANFAVFTGFTGTGVWQPVAVDLNQWQHIAVVYTPSNIEFYKNGVRFSFGSPATGQASNNRLRIGANPLLGGIEFYQGLIDEVEIFNRALSSNEISSIFLADSFGKCRPLMTNTASGQCSQVVSYSIPAFTDNCGATINCFPASGSSFPSGTTTVTCVIADACNSVTNSFTVTVKDNEPPTIICATNRTVECGDAWDFNEPTATDNCANVTIHIVSTVTNTIDFCGATFSATRTWEATDDSGNTSPCSQTITVVDAKPPQTCVTPPANMISWWPGEGNANDIQNGNHGTLSNGVMFTSGKVEQAFSLDGTDDFVNVPSSPSLDPITAITLDAWVSTATPADGTIRVIAGRPFGYQLNLFDDGRVGFGVRVGGSVQVVVSTGILPANTFAHVAGTYDSSTGSLKVYLNGVETAATLSGQMDSQDKPFQIGGFADPDFTGAFFKGLIDEVELFNRALSASEIQGIFHADTFGKCRSIVTNTAPGQCGQVVNYPAGATDNCSTNATIDCEPAPGSMFAPGTTTVTCIASDGCHSVTNTFTVTVNDTEAPMITCGTNRTVECGESWDFDEPTATDNCRAVVSVIDTETNVLCGATYSATRTWEGTDDSGNSNRCSQTITVVDTMPPVTCVTAPPNLIGWWPGEDNLNDIQGGYNGTGNGGGPGFAAGQVGRAMSFDGIDDYVTISNVPDPNVAFSFDLWVYWTGHLNPSSHEGLVVKLENTSSGLDSYGTFIFTGDNSLYNVIGGSITFNTPANSVPLNRWFHVAHTYDGTTARIYIDGNLAVSQNVPRTPSTGPLFFGNRGGNDHQFHGLLDEIEVFDRTLSADEVLAIFNAGNFGKCKPIVTNTAPGECSQIVSFPTDVRDNCSTNATINCEPAPGSAFPKGTTIVTCIASDGCNSVTNSFPVTVNDNEPPSIVCGTNRRVDCGTNWTFDPPTATDNCTTNVLVSILGTQTNALCGDTFSATRTWVADDGCGNTNTCAQTITVVDTTPPVITCPTNVIVECEQMESGCTNGQFCTYGQGGWGSKANDDGMNPGTILSNNYTTIYPGGVVEVGIPGAGAFSMKFTSSTAIETYIPAGMMPKALTNDHVNPTTTESGVFGGQVLALQLNVDFSFAGITPGGTNCSFGDLVFADPTSPLFGKTVREILAIANHALGGSNVSGYGVTIGNLNTLANNLNDSFGSCTQSAWARMNLMIPKTSSVEPSDSGVATATDTCDPNPTVTFSDEITTGSCLRQIRRTWMATDACSNSASCVQIIRFGDGTPPDITCASNKTVECGQSWDFDEPTAMDNCSGVIITNISTVTNQLCGSTYSATRTWTATDQCGNSNTCSQTVTVLDTVPPTISCPTNIVTCNSRLSFDTPSSTDACDPMPQVNCVRSDGQGFDQPYPTGSTIITCTATDACGNTNACAFMITVLPTISVTPLIDRTNCPGSTVEFCADVTGLDGAGSFATDFESGDPPGTSRYGMAYVGGDGTGNNVLHLTDAIYSQFGAFHIPDPFGGANVTNLSARWRSLIGGGDGADGYSFNWATDLPGTPSYGDPGEEGSGSGLIVSIDTFDNDFGDILGIELKWMGASVASGFVPVLRKNQFVDARLTVSDGVATFTYDGVSISANLPGFTGIAGGSFQFGARTGGLNDNHWIDDVRIGIPVDNCPVTFIWSKNGQVLAGQTNSCLVLNNVTAAHSGQYCVRAIGCCNTATNCARLTVPSPMTVACPKNKKVDCDDEWTFGPVGENFIPLGGEWQGEGEGQWFVPYPMTNFLCGKSYVATMVWLVADGQCGSLYCTQKVTVEASLDIDCADDKTVACGQPWDFDEPEVESCDDDVDVDIVYTTTTTLADGGVQHTRKWRVRDECGNEDTCKQVVTVLSDTPPVVVCAPNKVVECGSAWDFDPPSVTGGTLRVIDTFTNGVCGETFMASRIWEVTGGCGVSIQCNQNVAIVDTRAPVLLKGPTNKIVECGAVPPPARVGAADPVSDGPGGQLFLGAANVVGGSGTWNDPASQHNAFRIVDNQAGLISEPVPGNFWLGRDGDATEYIVIDLGRPYLIDQIDLFNTHNHVLDDRRTQDFQIMAGHAVTNAGTAGLNLAGATDLILSNRLTFHAAQNDPIEPDTFTAANGLAPGAGYRYLRIETLSGHGNDHVGLNEIRIFGRALCDPEVPVTFFETRTDGPCPQTYTLTRTWTATDDCGNSNHCAQIIMVRDTMPPAITCPVNLMVQGLAQVPAHPADLAAFRAAGGVATDACDSNLSYVCADGPFVPSAGGGHIERRHTVSDACGNSSSCVQLIRVEVAIAPVVPPLLDQMVCAGGTAIFAALPTGTGPFHFAWRHDGALLAGETNSFLAIAAANSSATGQYVVEVTGPGGRATNSGSLQLAAPTVAAPLTDLARQPGESAFFSTVASGDGPFTYTWRRDGALLAGETGNTLGWSAVTTNDAGTYTVEVSSRCNTVTNAATLTVRTPEPFAARLISHWRLDETNGVVVRDSAGANHGELIEGPLQTGGILGGALSLDGSDDCVEVPHSPSLNLSNHFSISFWFRPAQTLDATSGRRELVNKCLSYCIVLNAATNDGRIVFALNNGTPAVKSTTASWPSTRWSQIVCLHDGANLWLYVNGVLEATAPAGELPRVIGYPLLFGGDPEQGGFYAGALDDVRLYSTNLPPAAITAMFHSGRAALYAPTGLALTVLHEAGLATLRWNAVDGVRYRVEYKNNLGASEWIALPGEVTAMGGSASKADALGAHQRRFYRVIALP